MRKKILLLVRHAHRNKSKGREFDNGLSAKGRGQAERFEKYFAQAHPGAKSLFLSSPKKRCIETLIPAAKRARDTIQVIEGLDEGPPLRQKATAFIRWWKKSAPGLTVVSSHGDVIPEILAQLTGADIELKKGGFAEIEYDDYGARLTWVVQDLKIISKGP